MFESKLLQVPKNVSIAVKTGEIRSRFLLSMTWPGRTLQTADGCNCAPTRGNGPNI